MSSSSTQKPSNTNIDSANTDEAEPQSAILNTAAATTGPRRENRQKNRPASSPYARRVAREAEIRRVEHQLWKEEMEAKRLRVEKWLEDIYVAGAPPFGGGEGGLGERVERGALETERQSEEGLGEKALGENGSVKEEMTGEDLGGKPKDLSGKDLSEEELGEEQSSDKTLSGK